MLVRGWLGEGAPHNVWSQMGPKASTSDLAACLRSAPDLTAVRAAAALHRLGDWTQYVMFSTAGEVAVMLRDQLFAEVNGAPGGSSAGLSVSIHGLLAGNPW